VFAIGHYFFDDAMKGGQSFGKRALDMPVVHAGTGVPCTAGQSLVRNVLLYLLGPIDWVFIFGERRQRLGECSPGRSSSMCPVTAEGLTCGVVSRRRD
jgi:hypothetical protein